MSEFLTGLLPRILPDDYRLDENVFIRPHNGKSDLRKSLRNKAGDFHRYPSPVRLLVGHDQDANDCYELKRTIIRDIEDHRRASFPVCVRIACRELENWYLGSLEEVERLYPRSRASQLVDRRKYRNPDGVSGAVEMGAITIGLSPKQTAPGAWARSSPSRGTGRRASTTS